MERDVNWPEDRDRPQCPSGERLRAFLVWEKGGATGESHLPVEVGTAGVGCVLEDTWETLREHPRSERIRACRESCPRGTGQYPSTTPLYVLCLRHMELQEVGLAPARSEYTAREIAAIALVKREFARCWRKKGELDARK